jgi:hypothetical protein
MDYKNEDAGNYTTTAIVVAILLVIAMIGFGGLVMLTMKFRKQLADKANPSILEGGLSERHLNA